MKKKRMAKAKVVNYVLIPNETEIGQPMYERLYALIDAHHEDLSHTNVRIALAWQLGLTPDVDGRIVLGRCRKATDLDRELAPFDYVVLLNRDWWLHPRTTQQQREALLDHECCHMAIAFDKETGEPQYDDRGRNVFRMRRHTIEEFTEVVQRHGIYKGDVEAFASAVRRAEQATTDTWIGYTRLHETLKDLGIEIPATVIATWGEDERREVLTWAFLRKEAGERRINVALSPTAPSCLLAAVNPPDAATAH